MPQKTIYLLMPVPPHYIILTAENSSLQQVEEKLHTQLSKLMRPLSTKSFPVLKARSRKPSVGSILAIKFRVNAAPFNLI